MGYSSIDIKERFQWTYPIVFSPVDPKVLYATSQHVWRTTNDGQSWDASARTCAVRSEDDAGVGRPITKDQTGVETYAVVFTLAPSRQDVNTIWAGSDDGWVHVTRDGGKNWERITPPDLPEFARISLIEASPHQNGVAYLAPTATRWAIASPTSTRPPTSARRGRRSSPAFPTPTSRA